MPQPPCDRSQGIDDVRAIVRRCYEAGGPAELTEQQLGDLIALTWIARGLYAPFEWADARFEGGAAGDVLTVDRLLKHPRFKLWLTQGLAQLEGALAPTLH
jgi:hypothetical protein